MAQMIEGPRWARAWVDGGVFGSNPSPRGTYWSVRLEAWDGAPVVIRKRSGEYDTNNEAEWLALRELLLYCTHNPHDLPILVYSDSRLIVNQFNGKNAANDPTMRRLRDECRALAGQLRFVVVKWTPRTEIVKKLGH